MPASKMSKTLPGAYGNRRVRRPLYGGERLGWWRRTVNTSIVALGGACHPSPAVCEAHKKATSKRRRRARGGSEVAAVGHGLRGRRLRGPARYDMNTVAVPGVPCLAPMRGGGELGSVQQAIFEGYLHKQHVQRAELGRLQRWKCSWVYLLRACLVAEGLLGTASSSKCRAVLPPSHEGAMGWRGKEPSKAAEVGSLLFQLRCW